MTLYSKANDIPRPQTIFPRALTRNLHNTYMLLFLQSVLESLPGVDPQSDAVRQAVGAMSKSSTSKKDTDKKDDKDGKK